MSILRLLAEATEGMSLKAVSTESGLAPSTAHRLLTTLQTERFVRFESDTSLWRIGVGAFSVGSAYLRYRDVVALSRPHLRRLMNATGETASIYVTDEGAAICMAQVESREMMRAITRIGGRVPMDQSGAGRAILATLTTLGLGNRNAANTQFDRATTEEIARLGYAIDDELRGDGVRCVGAAILDEGGYPVAALSVSGPSLRIDLPTLARYGILVREAAEAVTMEMGGLLRAAE